jgi:hypothetical protein
MKTEQFYYMPLRSKPTDQNFVSNILCLLNDVLENPQYLLNNIFRTFLSS